MKSTIDIDIEEGSNPVEKVALVVTGNNGNLLIDELGRNEETDENSNNNTTRINNETSYLITQVRRFMQ